MVRGEIWGWTGFTGDSGASRFSFLSLDKAVKVILMFVLGNLKVHLREREREKESARTEAWVTAAALNSVMQVHAMDDFRLQSDK